MVTAKRKAKLVRQQQERSVAFYRPTMASLRSHCGEGFGTAVVRFVLELLVGDEKFRQSVSHQMAAARRAFEPGESVAVRESIPVPVEIADGLKALTETHFVGWSITEINSALLVVFAQNAKIRKDVAKRLAARIVVA